LINGCLFFFFQAEDGIRDFHVTGVQTCALPIFRKLLLLPLIASVMVACSKEKEIAGPVHPKVEKLNLLSGFKAEHLYSPGENDQGSWVAMTFDDKGRMITADQYGALYRLQILGLGA